MALLLKIESLLWSGPLLLGLLGTHLYFTLMLHGIQRQVGRGIRLSLNGPEGEVSRFGALSTSLAAAIGTGNIIGVATAVALGGPGAVFWCWLTGVLGMATRYAETVMVLRYREETPTGSVGGAMYVLRHRLRKPKLAAAFAVLGVLGAMGTGAMIQSNAVAAVLGPEVSPLWSGGLLCVLAGIILFGGGKRIAGVCTLLVPGMAALYLVGCGGVLLYNRAYLWDAVQTILSGAFSVRGAVGGAVEGGLLAARYGVARGLFTNEAGMGTAPMAAAAAPVQSLHQEGLAAMTGVFWDTVVICGVTGLVLATAELREPELFAALPPEQRCWAAFSVIPCGGLILKGSLVIFSFATVVGWSWYGRCCWRFLSPKRPELLTGLYLAAAFLGAFCRLELVWSLGSILAGLMAVPNLVALWYLRGEIRAVGRQEILQNG